MLFAVNKLINKRSPVKYIFLALLFSSGLTTKAQTFEFGLGLGAANYHGDLAPSLAFQEFNPHGAFFFKKNLDGFFSLKAVLGYGRISGNDAHFPQNNTRNLNFRSDLIELSGQFEFNFQKFLLGLRAKSFSPYVFSGIGLTYYNPQANYEGKWINLRPLSTEGQGLPNGPDTYSPLTVVLPLGGGLKWSVANNLNITAYLGYRYAFTDYLDDVSSDYFDSEILLAEKGELSAALADRRTDSNFFPDKERGNPDRNDWYFFAGFSISYWIQDNECFQF